MRAMPWRPTSAWHITWHGFATLAHRTWGQQLKAIGLNPRVASRYLKIAEHWPAEIGLNESDLLLRLPLDLLKLEWLCRVPLDPLKDLLRQLDCKKATRSRVIAAVREALGEDPPIEPDSDVDNFVQGCLRRLAKALDRLHEMFPEAEEQARGRELLAVGLREVQEALAAGPGKVDRPQPAIAKDSDPKLA